MATEILYSPLAEVRWAHLVEPISQAFLETLERQFIEAHGSKKRRSDKGEPWKPDKEQPSQLMVVKFKAQQLTRRDGSQAHGPRLIDARKQRWNGAAIGNGSRLVIACVIHVWDRLEGVGITLIPRAAQSFQEQEHCLHSQEGPGSEGCTLALISEDG
ncbi:MAG: hypothetical protein ACKO8I_17745, partial [Cyanobacteriota bacterium]